MRNIEFTDSHVHFWDLGESTLRYSWLDADVVDEDMGNYDAIKSLRYFPEDFAAESRFSNVTRVVHVQAATGIEDPVEETRWLQAFADDIGIPHGIVAYADLGAPGVADTLARHCAFPNVRGIRDLRYDHYLADETWRHGYGQLESLGLVCCDDPLVEAMSDAAELARAFPGITYCVDHAGFPRRRDPD